MARSQWVDLPEPMSCILCGYPAHRACVELDRTEPLHDFCDRQLWRMADAINRAKAERQAAR